MKNYLLSFTKKLVSIPSSEENPKALEKALDVVLQQLKGYTIEKFKKNGSKSALVYSTKKRPKKFTIILNAHLDVIPAKKYQYSPVIKGNRLYGAGSMDMKASVACLIEVFKAVSERVTYPLALQLVTDEEMGGFNGTKHQIDKGVRADFIIAGEPTNFDIVNKAKGILWLRIFAKGKTAHGAYPWRGENAISKVTGFLNALQKRYQNPKEQKWVTTVNISNIKTSNSVFNKIPDDCVVELDVRYIPEEADTIVKNIKKLLPSGFSMDIIEKEPAMFTDRGDKYVKLLKKTTESILNKNITLRGAQGSSDARHFERVSGAGIEFGPVGGGIGSDNEWVDIPSLEKYYQIIKEFLLSVV